MQIESHSIYAILGGIILGVGMGIAFGTTIDSLAATIAFTVGLSIMWATIFYTTTQSQQEDDAV